MLECFGAFPRSVTQCADSSLACFDATLACAEQGYLATPHEYSSLADVFVHESGMPPERECTLTANEAGKFVVLEEGGCWPYSTGYSTSCFSLWAGWSKRDVAPGSRLAAKPLRRKMQASWSSPRNRESLVGRAHLEDEVHSGSAVSWVVSLFSCSSVSGRRQSQLGNMTLAMQKIYEELAQREQKTVPPFVVVAPDEEEKRLPQKEQTLHNLMGNLQKRVDLEGGIHRALIQELRQGEVYPSAFGGAVEHYPTMAATHHEDGVIGGKRVWQVQEGSGFVKTPQGRYKGRSGGFSSFFEGEGNPYHLLSEEDSTMILGPSLVEQDKGKRNGVTSFFSRNKEKVKKRRVRWLDQEKKEDGRGGSIEMKASLQSNDGAISSSFIPIREGSEPEAAIQKEFQQKEETLAFQENQESSSEASLELGSLKKVSHSSPDLEAYSEAYAQGKTVLRPLSWWQSLSEQSVSLLAPIIPTGRLFAEESKEAPLLDPATKKWEEFLNQREEEVLVFLQMFRKFQMPNELPGSPPWELRVATVKTRLLEKKELSELGYRMISHFLAKAATQRQLGGKEKNLQETTKSQEALSLDYLWLEKIMTPSQDSPGSQDLIDQIDFSREELHQKLAPLVHDFFSKSSMSQLAMVRKEELLEASPLSLTIVERWQEWWQGSQENVFGGGFSKPPSSNLDSNCVR